MPRLPSAGINVRNIYGAIFVISAVLYPYVYIAARASFLVDSGRLFEAARTLGSTPFSNFWRIVLPVSRPAIVAGLSLVVMEVLNEYGAVKYYGISTFTTGIFRAWFSLEDLQAAIDHQISGRLPFTGSIAGHDLLVQVGSISQLIVGYPLFLDE